MDCLIACIVLVARTMLENFKLLNLIKLKIQ